MKFSIITPTYNTAPYLEETIESVISQAGNFDIEYIVMDGGSTDNTVEILKKYDQEIKSGAYKVHCNSLTFSWYSEKDKGMYDAINRGFAKASGDVYTWINADDTYVPGAFQNIADAFVAFPDIQWIKGTTSNIEADGTLIRKGGVLIYEQPLLAHGVYGRQAYFVEQDSVFWRADLWGKVGDIPAEYRLAGDYFLWIQFARHAPLWSLNAPMSRFRKRSDQLSQQVAAYKKEQRTIMPKTGYEFSLLRVFFTLKSHLGPKFERLFRTLYPALFMRSKKNYFIDIVSGEMVKKEATSYFID
ncbi:MAG: hypothetical protein A2481_02040 [Candidatus Yonathbacteria bacterium RIFOXYC2_FULL_47_9]|nr:MAG: hypothetical protein A2481_02040 [Candidatus Yonathbacteria bacterium RIFOXYC2_FULL_47_9]HAT68018.1 glycosyl transferase family 2 [Candidatus Yonathbacteria bacterium]